MSVNIRLISNNPQCVPAHHHGGAALHRLAVRLAGHVQAGNTDFAHAIAEIESLTPIEMGIVSVWMAKSGIGESQILAVMVGRQELSQKPVASLSA
ncbi:hypothetical protein MASR1M60_12790 [Rhodocyclaceae bacterium]